MVIEGKLRNFANDGIRGVARSATSPKSAAWR